MAQNEKKVASKEPQKPKVAENSKSCQNSKKLPKISKVAEQLVAKPRAHHCTLCRFGWLKWGFSLTISDIIGIARLPGTLKAGVVSHSFDQC